LYILCNVAEGSPNSRRLVPPRMGFPFAPDFVVLSETCATY
jgi:hypothetical protein